MKGLWVVTAVVVCCACKAPSKESPSSSSSTSAASDDDQQPKAKKKAPAPEPLPKSAALTVDVATLLKEYKDNEVRSDGKWKNKRLRLTGVVDEIKKDITDEIYVTVGTGAQFELPIAQCFFGDEHTQEASALSHGQKVTVECTDTGLMMNVILRDCAFAPNISLLACKRLELAGVATDCKASSPNLTVFGAKGSHSAGVVAQYDDEHVFSEMLKSITAKPKADMPSVYSSASAHVIVNWKTDQAADDAKIKAAVDAM